MVATPFEPQYGPDSYSGPLKSRPVGARAAFSMGVAASLILAAAAIANRNSGLAALPPQATASVSALIAATEPKPAAAKISAKIEAAPAPALPAQVKGLPFSAFDLNAPEFEREKKTIAVRDGDEGVGRVDSLTLGQFAMGVPFLRLDIHQDISEKEAAADFFLDMTRHAAQLGLNVAKIAQPAALSTRFGEFQTADMRLAQPAGEGVAASERACVATRLIQEKPSLEIAAIACGAASQPIDRLALGCILDRLDFKAAGAKTELGDFFAASEADRGKACNYSREDVTASIPHHGSARGKSRAKAHHAR